MDSYKKINLHTHTTFCDGKNSAEEMILSAIEKHFDVIGFSGHCLYPLSSEFYKTPDDEWHIKPENLQNYVNEINELKEKYKNKIEILLGFEADYFENPQIGSAVPDFNLYKPLNPDYLIGSVHFINTEKGFYTVDHSAENVRENLLKLYGNPQTGYIDGKKAVCDYFEAERQMLKKCNFSILGHADLIRKRNLILNFFSESENWYKEELKLTAKEIAKAGVIVEINSGAIARGQMDDFYPSEYFLTLLHDLNVPICINSDAHNTKDLDCAFERAAQHAKKIGYKELIYPVAGKNVHIKL